MKKTVKIICIILLIIFILGIVFFAVDYNRVQNGKRPIFCIKCSGLLDGGTVEFIGLGYKVIDFHTLAGFDDIKIGSWFMNYNDFEDEMKIYEDRFKESIILQGD